MKKGWKIFWIVTGSVAGVGVIFCGIALALGLTFSEIEEKYPNGIGFIRNEYRHRDNDSSHSYTRTPGEGERYSNVKNLEMMISGCDVYLSTTDGSEVRVDTQGTTFGDSGIDIDVSQEGDKLSVRTVKNGAVWNKITGNSKYYGEVYIYLPKELNLTMANLDFGAGELYIERIYADELTMNIGAGDCEVEEYKAGDVTINLGAGDIEMNGGFTGSLSLKCGAGDADFTLSGSKHDYNYALKSGLGSITIGEEEYGGLASTRTIDNGAGKNMDVICGAGDVSIEFNH